MASNSIVTKSLVFGLRNSRRLHPQTSRFSYQIRHWQIRFTRCLNNLNLNYLNLHIHNDVGVACLSLNRPPANTLSVEMLCEISKTIKVIEESHLNIQGLLLSSCNPKVFCGGLDIAELYRPDPHRLAQLWHSFQQVFLDLYSSHLVTVSAIDGHVLGGGCLLALACDYRIMASSESNESRAGTIGLNEAKLGLIPPYWMFELYSRAIGAREAEKSICLGALYSPEEAQRIGLVDRIVDHSHGLEEALKEFSRWFLILSESRRNVKFIARGFY